MNVNSWILRVPDMVVLLLIQMRGRSLLCVLEMCFVEIESECPAEEDTEPLLCCMCTLLLTLGANGETKAQKVSPMRLFLQLSGGVPGT